MVICNKFVLFQMSGGSMEIVRQKCPAWIKM